MDEIPLLKCLKHDNIVKQNNFPTNPEKIFLDDRMHTSCMLKGKHRCEDFDEIDNGLKRSGKYSNCKRICQTVVNNKCESNVQTSHLSHSTSTSTSGPSTSNYDQSNKFDTSYEFPGKFTTLRQKNCENLEKCDKLNGIINNEQHLKTPKLDIELSKDEIREVMQVLNQNSHKPKTDLKQQSKNKSNILRSVMLKNYHRHKDEKFQYDNENSTNLFCKEIKSVNLTFDKDDCASVTKSNCDLRCVRTNEHLDLNSPKKSEKTSDCDLRLCDKLCENSDIIEIKNKKKTKIYIDPDCDNVISHEPKAISKMRDISNISYALIHSNNKTKLSNQNQINDDCVPNQTSKNNDNNVESDKTINKTNENTSGVIDIPSPIDQAKFRKSFDNAASMVFHSKTGLPLTSSPAPVRKGKKCFDFDSSINSVSAIKRYNLFSDDLLLFIHFFSLFINIYYRALFSTSISTDEESESDGSIVSPCSPESFVLPNKEVSLTKYYRRGNSGNLLGS